MRYKIYHEKKGFVCSYPTFDEAWRAMLGFVECWDADLGPFRIEPDEREKR